MGLFFGKCTSQASLSGKVAIVTGCNTGIGYHTVLDFYKRGCKVIMACRDVNKAEKAKNEIMESCKSFPDLGILMVKKLDLGSVKSIKKFAEEVLAEEEKIHLLINNAGLASIYPRQFTEDGFEMTFGVNHLGHFLLTMLLLPRIIQSGPSRIVNVASIMHYLGKIDFDDLKMDKYYNGVLAYSNTKLANILFTKELAKRLEGKNVNVYALHPGFVKTDIDRHADEGAFFGSYFLYHYVLGYWFKTPEQGAETTIHCAVDEKLNNESGFYYVDCKRASTARKAQDMEAALKLWEVSWKMLKLGDYDPFNF